MPSADELAILRALPLEVKIQKSKQRIREWLEREESYVAFSGGKDSTVLAHLVHQVDPNVPLVFSNTGLEYQAIQSFARKMGAEFIRPEMRFDEVISTYGYPIISKEVAEAIYYARRIRDGAGKTPKRERAILEGKLKSRNGEKSIFNKEKWLPAARDLPFNISHYCCHKMKKSPSKKYEKAAGRSPFIGTLTEESRIRKNAWIRHGCNAFDGNRRQSTPLAFWTNQDILQYIKTNNLEICSVYGDVVEKDGKL